MSIREIQQGDLTWINVEELNEESLNYLRQKYHFHHLDLEDLQSESQTPKIDVYKNYLFLILQFPAWDAVTQTVIPFEVDFFIGENYLITVQHQRSKDVKTFFYRCMKNRRVKKDWMGNTSGYLLYRLIDALYHNSRPILNNLGKRISLMEQDVFTGEPDTKIIRQLALHRRNVLSFRRIIDPQRYLVSNLSHTRKPFLNENTSLYFDDINDYLNKLWAIVDNYQDTVHGLHVTVESLINQRTNKVISSLTVISVSLLPLTLLSGIYGMNIDNLPFAHDPQWVWAMFAGLGLFILGVILAMKRKRWL